MTDEELLRFCAVNETVRVERDANGELLLMTPAGGGTSHKNTLIIVQLGQWAERTNSGLAFDSNAGFTLPDGSMRSPDAAWIAWSRWNALTLSQQEVFAPISPDFIIELRSPSDRLSGLQAKMAAWTANGVQLAWLIDPLRKTVEIYRPGREAEMIEGSSFVEGDGPVEGFVLELGRIWA
ncbi:MAG TPA: Uma2 family endonuclease [Acidobacteriaceae bacterium]